MPTVRQQVKLVVLQPAEVVFDTAAARFFETATGRSPSIISMEKTSVGGMGAGTTGRSISEDDYGRRLETTYEVIEFTPPFRFAYRAISRFAHEQPNWSKPLNRDATTPELRSMTLEPIGDHTRATFRAEVIVNVGLYYKLFWWPYFAGNYKLKYQDIAYRFRDDLEKRAGLPQRPRPLFIRPAWRAWGIFLLLFLLVLGVYSIRGALGISSELADLLRATMSLMIVIAFVIVFMVGVYENTVRSRVRRHDG